MAPMATRPPGGMVGDQDSQSRWILKMKFGSGLGLLPKKISLKSVVPKKFYAMRNVLPLNGKDKYAFE